MNSKVGVSILLLIIVVGAIFYMKTAQAPIDNNLANNSTNSMNLKNPHDVIFPNDGKMHLISPSFALEATIPLQNTCDSANISPEFMIDGVPEGAKSLVLIMDDPDVPKQLRPDGVFDHWVVFNLSKDTRHIPENVYGYPNRDRGIGGVMGLNGRGEAKYTGPCPPTNYQPTTHRYIFKLYAIDLPSLEFSKVPTKREVLAAIEGHVLATAEYVGVYDRSLQLGE
jgi:Raf kinase inhibitor-like YbhB/YbcL family protein